APAFVRPGHELGREIEFPAADMRDALRFDEQALALAQLVVGPRPLDGSRGERGGGLEDVDLEAAPDPLDVAVVEAKEAPQAAAQHDRHREERLGVVYQEEVAVRTSELAEDGLDRLAALAALRPFVEDAELVDQRDVLEAGIAGESQQARLGIVVAAGLDRPAGPVPMNLEQADAADSGGLAHPVEQLLNADAPVGAADDLLGC